MKDPFSELRESIQQCRICESSLPFGPRPVVQIDRRAKVLIAGQAPGRRVHESGVLFCDRAMKPQQASAQLQIHPVPNHPKSSGMFSSRLVFNLYGSVTAVAHLLVLCVQY